MYKLGLLFLLGACSSAQTTGVASFRSSVSAPIYSNAVLQSERMAGSWAQVASFATATSPACAPGDVTLVPAATGLAIEGALCVSGKSLPVSGTLTPVGPGRFALRGAAPEVLGQAWWVLWADVDYRTLVIGTPSGAFGFILNRDGLLPADRRVAAVEILDFNSYRTDSLVIVPKSP